jgi:Flp pilus assembly pilin Flp
MSFATAGVDVCPETPPLTQRVSVAGLISAFVIDDRGQDVIEYALLAALIAVVGMAALNAIFGSLNGTYTTFDNSQQQLSTMPDPPPI